MSANKASVNDNSTHAPANLSVEVRVFCAFGRELDFSAMNHVIAYKLLADELATYRQLPVDEIRQLTGEHSTRLVRGEDGVDYSLTVVVRSHSAGDIGVVGFIGIADWGNPHDVLDDRISIGRPCKAMS